jgi:hypothetical protein
VQPILALSVESPESSIKKKYCKKNPNSFACHITNASVNMYTVSIEAPIEIYFLRLRVWYVQGKRILV